MVKRRAGGLALKNSLIIKVTRRLTSVKRERRFRSNASKVGGGGGVEGGSPYGSLTKTVMVGGGGEGEGEGGVGEGGVGGGEGGSHIKFPVLRAEKTTAALGANNGAGDGAGTAWPSQGISSSKLIGLRERKEDRRAVMVTRIPRIMAIFYSLRFRGRGLGEFGEDVL